MGSTPFLIQLRAAGARIWKLQTLRDIGRASLLREAFGVRRIPPLLILSFPGSIASHAECRRDALPEVRLRNQRP